MIITIIQIKIILKKIYIYFFSLPLHVSLSKGLKRCIFFPEVLKPFLHSQWKLPFVLTHVAFCPHRDEDSLHLSESFRPKERWGGGEKASVNVLNIHLCQCKKLPGYYRFFIFFNDQPKINL